MSSVDSNFKAGIMIFTVRQRAFTAVAAAADAALSGARGAVLRGSLPVVFFPLRPSLLPPPPPLFDIALSFPLINTFLCPFLICLFPVLIFFILVPHLSTPFPRFLPVPSRFFNLVPRFPIPLSHFPPSLSLIHHAP